MKDWGFFEWLAYGGIALAALLLAIDTWKQQRTGGPFLSKSWWGYVPLVLLAVSFLTFLGIQTGILEASRHNEKGSLVGCLKGWGVNENSGFYVTADGRCFPDKAKDYFLSAVAFHEFGVLDPMDESITVKGGVHEIGNWEVTIVMTKSRRYMDEYHQGHSGTAVREFKLERGHGFVDYLLFVDGNALARAHCRRAAPTGSSTVKPARSALIFDN